MSTTAQVLREYGEAIRGDWSEIDGRSVRGQLDSIALWVENPNRFPGLPEARRRLGICSSGGGHWLDHCDLDCP